MVNGVPPGFGDEHVEHVSASKCMLKKSGEHLCEPAIKPTLQHGRPGHHQRRLDHPLRRIEYLCAGLVVESDGVEGVARAEEGLHVQHRDHELANDKRKK